MENKIKNLEKIAHEIRKHIVRMITEAGSGHPGGSLSSVEILTALYFDVLKHDVDNPQWSDRDRFIMSKGHGAPALYATLAEAGYIEKDSLITLRKLGSPLQGHLDRRFMPMLEASTGSLGQGLSIGIGYAQAAKIDSKDYKTFVLLGDGECDEGQVWEAAMFAGFHKLDNLITIVDFNKIQLDGHTKDILNLEPFEQKWQAFGWETKAVDGNNMKEVLNILTAARTNTTNKPLMILADTVKGKGVSFMEDNVAFHGKAPNQEQFEKAMQELEEKNL